MDQWKTDLGPSTSVHNHNSRLQSSHAEPSDGSLAEVKDPVVARKVQKADREKLRRDRLNDHFLELGNTLDPERPKNDKATILADTIQVLRDLTAEVTKLKADYTALSEESPELMQEKNELREEKVSLKSDIENLNAQYQQSARVMYPWLTMDPSLLMGPTYPYPVPIPVPQGSIPMHPSLQPFPFYGNQSPAPCSTFIPYPTHANPTVEPHSVHFASSSHVSSKQDSKSKSSEQQQRRSVPDRTEDSNDVATVLELKMPGSSSAQKGLTTREKKGKQMQRNEKSAVTGGSSSSRISSSQDFQDSSSTSVGDIPRPSK